MLLHIFHQHRGVKLAWKHFTSGTPLARDERPIIAMDFGVDDGLGTFLALVDSSTGCMRAISAESKWAADHLASSVGRFRLRCGNETSIMAVTQTVNALMPDCVVVENTPRHSSASNGLAERATRTNGEQLRTLRYDMQNRYKTRITLESTFWPCMVGHAGFCVTRYARGAGGITPFVRQRSHARDCSILRRLSCSK